MRRQDHGHLNFAGDPLRDADDVLLPSTPMPAGLERYVDEVDYMLHPQQALLNAMFERNLAQVATLLTPEALQASVVYANGNRGPLILLAVHLHSLNMVELFLQKPGYNPLPHMPALLALTQDYEDIEIAYYCITKLGLDINQPVTKSGDTLLLWAVKKNNVAMVRELCAIPGINPLQASRSGTTPVVRAIAHNQWANTIILTRFPAVWRYISPGTHYTLLHHAVRRNGAAFTLADGSSVSVVASLIERKAYVNATALMGITPLMMAAENGYTALVQTLMHHKAQLDLQDLSGQTALMFAAEKGQADVIHVLTVAKAALDAHDHLENTALLLAAENGHTDTVRYLADAKASLNTQNAEGQTALILAANAGHEDVCGSLLTRKANPNSATRLGGTALMMAAQKNFTPIVKVLVVSGANVNATLNDATSTATALYLAAQNGHVQPVRTLLACKADASVRCRGLTAMAAAIQHQWPNVLKAMIQAGVHRDRTARSTQLWDALKASNPGQCQRMADIFSQPRRADAMKPKKAAASELGAPASPVSLRT